MCERFSQAQKDACNAGAGCCVYRRPDTVVSADKGDHRSRSESNDTRTGGSHSEHWKKEEKKK